MKLIFIIFIFIFLTNCSLHKDSKYWAKDSMKEEDNNKKIIKIIKKIKKSENITTMTVNEYKIYVDEYTKKSKYPDINQ